MLSELGKHVFRLSALSAPHHRDVCGGVDFNDRRFVSVPHVHSAVCADEHGNRFLFFEIAGSVVGFRHLRHLIFSAPYRESIRLMDV